MCICGAAADNLSSELKLAVLLSEHVHAEAHCSAAPGE